MNKKESSIGNLTKKIFIKGRKMFKTSKKRQKQAEIMVHEETLLIGDVEWHVQIYNCSAEVTKEPVKEKPVLLKIENIIQSERFIRNYSINRRNAIRKKRSI